MSSANIEVSEIQPRPSRAEQEGAAQFANGLVTTLLRLLKVDEHAWPVYPGSGAAGVMLSGPDPHE